MKRILLIAFAVVFALCLLAACNKNENANVPVDPADDATPNGTNIDVGVDSSEEDDPENTINFDDLLDAAEDAQ